MTTRIGPPFCAPARSADTAVGATPNGSLCTLFVVSVAAADPVQMYLACQCGVSPQVTLSGLLQDDHVAAGVVDDAPVAQGCPGSVEPHACGTQPLVVVSRSSEHRTSPCREPGAW